MNRIAIDLDEVLVPFLRPLAKFHGRALPPSERCKNYVFREVFDCSQEESASMVRAYYQSPEFLYERPIIGSQRAMHRLRGQFDKMYILTGRQDVAREQTERWIETWFPDTFDDVILTNSYTKHEVSKVDMCRALSIGCLIDDSGDACEAALDAGVRARHFIGSMEGITYPWCVESDIAMRGWRDV